MSDMTPSDPVPVPLVRFLKLLVTALAITMIAGLVTIIWLFVTRLPTGTEAPLPKLPDQVVLPAGAVAQSLSFTPTRIVVLTADDRVFVYTRDGQFVGATALHHAEGAK